jgi:hypothetical protein
MYKHPISDDTIQLLNDCYQKSKDRQTRQTVDFQLTREQYFELVMDHHRAAMRIDDRYAKWLQSNQRKPFKLGYVLSWISYAAFYKGIMSVETACFVNKDQSKKNCRMKSGDKHTAKTKAKIGKKLKGRVFSAETKAKFAKAKIGSTQSEETKARRKATWLKKKEAKNAPTS